MRNNLFLSYAVVTMLMFTAVSCDARSSNASASMAQAASNKSIYDFTMKDIDGKMVPLSAYKGKIVVIVNTASQCGLTGQLSEIESFYKKYKDKGIVVLGFPANDFLGQEPLNDAEIKSFCSKNYGVTFPMFSKISVKGDDMAPLYRFLTSKSENGITDAPVSWNFQKFLIDKEGRFVTFFAPKTSVKDEKVTEAIQTLLK